MPTTPVLAIDSSTRGVVMAGLDDDENTRLYRHTQNSAEAATFDLLIDFNANYEKDTSGVLNIPIVTCFAALMLASVSIYREM